MRPGTAGDGLRFGDRAGGDSLRPKHAAIVTQALHKRGRGVLVERLGEREFETAGASRAGEREWQAGEGLQACIGERRKLTRRTSIGMQHQPDARNGLGIGARRKGAKGQYKDQPSKDFPHHG